MCYNNNEMINYMNLITNNINAIRHNEWMKKWGQEKCVYIVQHIYVENMSVEAGEKEHQ